MMERIFKFIVTVTDPYLGQVRPVAPQLFIWVFCDFPDDSSTWKNFGRPATSGKIHNRCKFSPFGDLTVVHWP